MKQTALIVLLFFVTLGVALWALGVFTGEKSTVPEIGGPSAPPAPGMGDTGLAAPDVESKEEPTPEIPEFTAPVRVLVLGNNHRSFTAWLELLWDFVPQGIQWQAWYTETAAEGVRTHSDSLPALEHAPVGPDLEAVQVLVLSGFDPSTMPADFWVRVADRVKSGSIGLLVVAENRFAAATGAEPSLASVLPVKGVKPVLPTSPGSTDLAGVFPKPVALRATEAGTKHPATRIVSAPGWSRKMWEQQATTSDEGRWETKFCAAVEGPVAGATVLVETDSGVTRWPSIVAHDSPTRRVLWVGGFFDVSNPAAYVGTRSVPRFRAMSISWIAWLAGMRS